MNDWCGFGRLVVFVGRRRRRSYRSYSMSMSMSSGVRWERRCGASVRLIARRRQRGFVIVAADGGVDGVDGGGLSRVGEGFGSGHGSGRGS